MTCLSSPIADWKSEPKTWGILSDEERGWGSPDDWQLIVAACVHTLANTHNEHTHMQSITASFLSANDLQDS